MVKVTVKSLASMKELLPIIYKGAMTFELSEEEASKFFELAKKKRLLGEVDFCNVDETSCSSEKMKKTRKTGLTQAIKRIFDANPERSMTYHYIGICLKSMGFETNNLSSTLYRLEKSGYLTSTDKVEGQFKTYKKKRVE